MDKYDKFDYVVMMTSLGGVIFGESSSPVQHLPGLLYTCHMILG